MFPLRDENPTVHTSVATFSIIGLNVAAWTILQGLGTNPTLAESVCKFGLIPGELLNNLTPGTRIALGRGFDCIISDDPNWASPLTSMFMHGGWLHLIINMWFLFIFGDNVEDVMGVGRFILFYLLCGMGAVAAQLISNPTSAVPIIGASGAIGGVMGAYALLYPKAPVHLLVFLGFFITRIVVPAYFMLGYWFVLQVLEGLASTGNSAGGVAFWAHVGGFVTGILLVKLFCNSEQIEACKKKRGRTKRLMEKIR